MPVVTHHNGCVVLCSADTNVITYTPWHQHYHIHTPTGRQQIAETCRGIRWVEKFVSKMAELLLAAPKKLSGHVFTNLA